MQIIYHSSESTFQCPFPRLNVGTNQGDIVEISVVQLFIWNKCDFFEILKGCDYSGQLVGLNSHKGGPYDYLGQPSWPE